MPLIPYLMNEILHDAEQPLYDQNFGLGLMPTDLVLPTTELLSVPLRCGYLRPWRLLESADSGVSNITHDKGGLKINLDVQQFKPNELKVKVVDNCVVIEGKHEERSDEHGFVSRQFTRRYKLPDDVDKQALTSNLSSDGVLQLQAPRLASLPSTSEQSVPIVQTNKPAIKASQGKKGGKVEKMES